MTHELYEALDAKIQWYKEQSLKAEKFAEHSDVRYYKTCVKCLRELRKDFYNITES